ncbi:MAG: molybdopterin-dependent oxidoreductase [Clostridiales bacterium]|nr:molybdopterin-dependent oxidoreductase [Clostridiales bacterium]
MTETDRLIKAKIPGEETGIQVRGTICDICSPSFHCGVDAYVRDGKIIKIEGTKEHPQNSGVLCTKGLGGRQYVYREDRLKTPLRRLGPRGGGKFEAIAWEEAYKEIALRMGQIKEKYGPESVLFFSGYSKWYRPYLHRFAYNFGSPNYGTESSTCQTSTFMVWDTNVGRFSVANTANAGVFLGWAFNAYYSRHLALKPVVSQKARGMKVIIIDPRITPASRQLADLHLRPFPGTDGALALGMGKLLIDKGWIDKDYIDKHVFGFEQYKEYVQQFDIVTVENITGVPGTDIEAAVYMMSHNGSMAINESAAPLAHHKNGYQNYRAVMALSAITGNYDRLGGQIPVSFTYNYQAAGFQTREKEFINAARPSIEGMRPRVGAARYPLWNELTNECQITDLTRQINEGTPYPIKGIFALGMNYRIMPDSGAFQRALDKVDFFLDTDLFLTDTAKLADIVLPVCSSFERGELKAYPGGFLQYTNPVIEPLYESKSDVEILSDLSREMKLGDPLLEAGYEECIRYILQDLPITVEELRSSPLPVLIDVAVKPYVPGAFTERGYNTPSGKFEIYSNIIAAKCPGLDPLPTYVDSRNHWDEPAYPFLLNTGPRLPGALHSRLHKVPWLRSLRPNPALDISGEDAAALGIAQGDAVELATPNGVLELEANVSWKVLKGVVHLYHGYSEADVNSLVDGDNNDPYSGFPGYRTTRCAVRKRAEGNKKS